MIISGPRANCYTTVENHTIRGATPLHLVTFSGLLSSLELSDTQVYEP